MLKPENSTLLHCQDSQTVCNVVRCNENQMFTDYSVSNFIKQITLKDNFKTEIINNQHRYIWPSNNVATLLLWPFLHGIRH